MANKTKAKGSPKKKTAKGSRRNKSKSHEEIIDDNMELAKRDTEIQAWEEGGEIGSSDGIGIDCAEDESEY